MNAGTEAIARPASRTVASPNRRVRWGFGLAFASLFVVGAVSYSSVMQLRADAGAVARTHAFIGALDALRSHLVQLRSGAVSFLLTGEERVLESYQEASAAIAHDLQTLQALAADDDEHRASLERLRPMLVERAAFARQIVTLRREEGMETARSWMLANEDRPNAAREMIDAMKGVERGLLQMRERRAARAAAVTQSVIIAGSVLACLFLALSLWAIRRNFLGRAQAEAELERFFSLSLDFLCIASSDGYFKRISPAVSDVLGWSVKEFLSTPYMDLVHPDDQAATQLEVQKQVVAGEKVLHFENRYRHKDGSWRTLSWRSMPQPGGLMYATARDVTEIKHAEAVLRESNVLLEQRVAERTAELTRLNTVLKNSERRFRALIEHGSDGISLIDEHNKILYLSPATTAVEGYAPDELLGRSGLEHTHPDDLPLIEQTVRQLVASPGEPIPVSWRRRHKDGRWIWLEGVATNLLHDPAVRAIVTNYRDVTQRKESEAKLRAQLSRLSLLSQITHAIAERQDIDSIFQVAVGTLEEELPLDLCCVLAPDAQGNGFKLANLGQRTEKRLSDLRLDGQDIVGTFPFEMLGGALIYEPDLSQTARPSLRRLAEGGLGSLVVSPLTMEGSTFAVLLCARDEVRAFSSGECEFLRQLTDHVALAANQARLHASLQEAYDELRRTQKSIMQHERLLALGQMASGIAHDINNAISPVSLYTESLLEREPNLSPRTRQSLEIIKRSIGDVALTVARMREFYRQRDELTTRAAVDLNRIVQEVLDLTRARWSDMAQQRGVSIEVRKELAADLRPIMGVENEIRDALTNLVFNAIDAMPDGGTLTLRTELTRRNGLPKDETIVLEVADSGLGMDEETRRRCLEPFFTTKGERGTGLGLATVYGAAQRHDAEVAIDSAPGRGTTVRLSFPVPETILHDAAQTGASPILPEPARILVIDDDPMLLKSLSDVLQSDGHQVTAVNGGQAGIDEFKAARKRGEPYSIVITDLGMPQIDGRKVSAAIKSSAADTPIILLTGWGQRLATEGEVPPHVDEVLSKPPKIRELREALLRGLRRG